MIGKGPNEDKLKCAGITTHRTIKAGGQLQTVGLTVISAAVGVYFV